jgi:TM2 domain-containing membrane protein YozV
MFKIIGTDGRQYGPVSAEQVRTWITEGRVNAQSLVQAEGSPEWKAVANFPELIAVIPPPRIYPTPPAAVPGADKKIAAGICGIVLGGLGIHKFILGYTGEGLVMLLVSVLTCGIAYFVMAIIGLIEGITYLTKSDEEFVGTYIRQKKGWF